MTTLITGAGLIAAHTGRALQDRGEQVVFYDLNPSREYLKTVLDVDSVSIYKGEVTNLPELVGIAQKHQVSRVVHTASLIGAQVSNQPYHGVNVNVNGSIAVMEAARLAKAERLVFCSSMAIYDFEKLPAGSLITEEAPLGPKNLYGATKLAVEQILSQYGLIYGVNVIHLRMAGVFGRGQFVGGSWMGRILNRALEASLSGDAIVVKSEWLGVNEYVFVKDVAAAFAAAVLNKDVPAGGYNIGTGVLHDADGLLDEIRAIAPNAPVKLEKSSQMVSYLQRDQPFDISKAETLLGYQPHFTLRTGLVDYLDELALYRGHYERLA